MSSDTSHSVKQGQASPEFEELCRRLIAAGVPQRVTVDIRGWRHELEGPVTILGNTTHSARPNEDILVHFGYQLTAPNELGAVVMALKEKGLKHAGEFFVSLLRDPAHRLSGLDLCTGRKRGHCLKYQ
mgnify:CR=1 FL=1